MYLENERRRRSRAKQMNVSCLVFQCSGFLAALVLGIVLGACFVLQDSHCPISSLTSAVGKHNTLHVEGKEYRKRSV